MGREIAKVGVAQGVKQGWLGLDKSHNPPLLRRRVSVIDDELKPLLTLVAKNARFVRENVLNDLKTRKLANRQYVRSCRNACRLIHTFSVLCTQHPSHTDRSKRRQISRQAQDARCITFAPISPELTL
jgi:hypothetical protein